MTSDTTTSDMDSTTVAEVPDQAAAPGREHRQVTPPEDRYATELAFLAAHDTGPNTARSPRPRTGTPPNWPSSPPTTPAPARPAGGSPRALSSPS